MKSRIVHALLALSTAFVASCAAAADDFPSRPIRIVVNTAPGGLTDITTRLVAQKMGEKLGQSVIIDNKAGADGLLGIRYVKTQPADGYTLLGTAGTVAIQPAVKLDPGYDLLKDFTGVGPMVRSPVLLVEGMTIAEQGVPGYSYYLWLGLVAPAGTPRDALTKLSEALHFALNSKELKDRMREDGSEPMIMSPDEYTEFLKRDSSQMQKLVDELGIQKQ
jgi:tripartite-type tricarboxylate transporter receptor subunit TctC